MKRERIPQGFTLLELLVTIAIATVIGAIAVPALSDWTRRTTTRTVVQKLATAITHTRAAAVNKNERAVICYLDGDGHCDNAWENPLSTFIDRDEDAELDGDDSLLMVVDIIPEGGDLDWSAFGSNRYIAFRPNGQTVASNGRMTYCPPGGDPRYAHQVILARTGRIRLARDTDNDGIREGSGGAPLDCD